MTVAELESRMTTREFGEWLAYYAYDPFGNERGDLRSAVLCALLANINRDSKHHPRPFKTEDFLLKFKGDEPKPQSQDEQKRMVRTMNTALGGEVRNERQAGGWGRPGFKKDQ